MSMGEGISFKIKLLNNKTRTGVIVSNWLTVIAGNKLRDRYWKPCVIEIKTIPYTNNINHSLFCNDFTWVLLFSLNKTINNKTKEANKYLNPEKSIGVAVFNPILIITNEVDQRNVTRNAPRTEIK